MLNLKERITKFICSMNPLELTLTIVGFLSSLFVLIVSSGFFLVELWTFKTIILISMFLLGILPQCIVVKDNKITYSFSGFLVLALSVAPLVYLITQIPRLIMTYGSFWTTWDLIFGTMFIAAVLELTRRCFGLMMPLVGLFFFLYVLFGNLLPSQFMGHTGFSFGRTISYMFGPAAIFGEIMSVFVRVVFVYLLFGTFFQYSGAADFFMKLATSIAGSLRGGPAKIAVVASALLGTINGNSVANVATTGAVTIPLMKKTGYSPYFAGAVEAAASTGGQFLPPIMGAAAFIMAELLSISYADVIIAATIPALLYFVSVFFMVDLEAVRLGLKGMEPENIPNFKEVIKKGGHLFIPIFVLIYQLIVVRMSVTKAGLYAILLLTAVSWLQKDTRMGMVEIIKALSEGARSAVGIAAVIATAGLVVGAVGMTGLGMRFSSLILAVAQDNFYLVAFFTALICLVLGMGMPTTAAYIISVSVAATTMLRIGVDPVAAHLFVFYFAAISTITPPVAASSYTAAAIAKSPIMKTALYATMLGIAGFVVPFLFLTHPALLMKGTATSIIWTFATATAGLASLTMAFEGVSFIRGIKWNLIQRLLFGSASIGLIIPDKSTDIIGLGIFSFAVFLSPEIWKKIFYKK